jgi:hypothetical protein
VRRAGVEEHPRTIAAAARGSDVQASIAALQRASAADISTRHRASVGQRAFLSSLCRSAL